MTDIGHGESLDTDIGRDTEQDKDLETPPDVGLDIGPRFVEDEIAPEQPELEQHNETDSRVGAHTLEIPHPETRSGVDGQVQSVAIKGAVISAAALGVIGLSNLMPARPVETPTTPIEPTPIVEQVDPGEVLFDAEDSAQEQAPKAQQLTPAKSEIETADFAAPWWHEVPTTSQQGLKYNGRNTQFGCAPTAVSMVLDYWHTQDQANQTMSAQALLDANVTQGIFVGKGMSITNIHDEITGLGYDVVQDYADADLDTLKQHVTQGPVVAAVKLNMKTSGHNHSVVVTGISEDNQVRLNDPWTGDAHTYTWDEFSRSWGADFGTATENHFTVIRPK